MGLNTITSLSRSGLKDWYLQRLSAVVLLAYVLFLVGFALCHIESGVNYDQWHQLFACHWMKVFTFIAAISLIAHAWVGIWTILTDYVKCSILMGIIQSLCMIAYIATLAWVSVILWF
jgi:succinate dehydrogenase / fumarate reductase membrane anchor subunit